jgi:hypothetical protein
MDDGLSRYLLKARLCGVRTFDIPFGGNLDMDCEIEAPDDEADGVMCLFMIFEGKDMK